MRSMLPLVLCGAAAGALGWGIRGQYGHETGAMIAGVLVSLVLVWRLRPEAPAWWAMRAVAFGAIGVGFGGAMTYGQTIGLTQDAALVGNWDALRWGMLGLGLKGALWIGFFGACLGMAMGGVRYRSREMLVLLLALVGMALFGTHLLNEPYDPGQRLLPQVYFSASWEWRPDVADLRPRREVWGGLLMALASLGAYVGLVRRDRFAIRLLGWGVLGGALGFPLGQALQAFHAWHPAMFAQGLPAALDPYVNWWNLMETTFGAVMGGTLALGAWTHRALVEPHGSLPTHWPAAPIELAGLAAHVVLLLIAEFTDVPVLGRYADVALVPGVLPLALAATGRWSGAVIALPVTLLPIAGKTVRRLVYDQQVIDFVPGWMAYAIVPVIVTSVTAWWIVRRAGADHSRRAAAVRLALVIATWTYVALNFAVFEYPWPWTPWTNRTLHALIFFACALGLTACARTGALRPRQHA
jgi:hypothetical protein